MLQPDAQPGNSSLSDSKAWRVGSVALAPPGRMVAFSTVTERRLRPFELVDKTKPGRFRWLTLLLVDPHYRVCSTRNVPQQQNEWWAEAVARELQTLAGDNSLPQEVLDQILTHTDGWPMDMDEALWHRDYSARYLVQRVTTRLVVLWTLLRTRL
ncbi:hypothetical protein Sste5346_005571 [Sporothrix stenoceras]|uniref:DUF4246 domain-containing protein n=1 Tax=Sporothrix stenoceras TaxID=5173 RepID=A0ABR3Z3R9_9PEZI